MAQVESRNFTREEILSQPTVWQKSLNSWRNLAIDAYPRPENYDQAVFIGCGSTYFLSRWAARTCEELTGVTCRAVPSSDLFLYPDAWLTRGGKTLLIASSRSAATTETIKAVTLFEEREAGDTVLVTCNPDRPLALQTKYTIGAPFGQERSVAQTRSFTSMMLGNALLIGGGATSEVSSSVRHSGDRLLSESRERMSGIAHTLALQRFFFLGSGALYGLACECMLKMKEMSLSYSEAYHVMEFRHGPVAMVDASSLVIGLLGEAGVEHEMAVLRDMKGKGARILAIAETAPPNYRSVIDDLIVLESGLSKLWRGVLYMPALQWLAYERAVKNGLDPDRPMNLDAVVVLND